MRDQGYSPILEDNGNTEMVELGEIRASTFDMRWLRKKGLKYENGKCINLVREQLTRGKCLKINIKSEITPLIK